MKNLIWHIEKRGLEDLKFWDKNPRQISKENYERLKQRIIDRGFHDVLKLDENNVVLSGNQRLKALRELGFKEIDCKIPNRKLTDEEKDKIGLESNINDGSTDFNLLMDNFDIDLLQDVGFSEEELEGSTEEKLIEKAIELKAYKKVHILISIDVANLENIVGIVDQMKKIEGVEIEQTAN